MIDFLESGYGVPVVVLVESATIPDPYHDQRCWLVTVEGNKITQGQSVEDRNSITKSKFSKVMPVHFFNKYESEIDYGYTYIEVKPNDFQYFADFIGEDVTGDSYPLHIKLPDDTYNEIKKVIAADSKEKTDTDSKSKETKTNVPNLCDGKTIGFIGASNFLSPHAPWIIKKELCPGAKKIEIKSEKDLGPQQQYNKFIKTNEFKFDSTDYDYFVLNPSGNYCCDNNYKKGIKDIVDSVRSDEPNAKIYVETASARVSDFPNERKEFNDDLIKGNIAGTVNIIDSNLPVKAANSELADPSYLTCGDGCHYTPLGDRRMAVQIYNTLFGTQHKLPDSDDDWKELVKTITGKAPSTGGGSKSSGGPKPPGGIDPGTPNSPAATSVNVGDPNNYNSCADQESCRRIDEAWMKFSSFLGVAPGYIYDPVNKKWIQYFAAGAGLSTTAPTAPIAPTVGGNIPQDCSFLTKEDQAKPSQAVGSPSKGSLVNGYPYKASTESDKYGTIELVNLLELSANYLKQNYGVTMSVHSMSKEDGVDNPGHETHQNGLNADVGLIHSDDKGNLISNFDPQCELSYKSGRYCKENTAHSSFTNKKALQANWDLILFLSKAYDLKYILTDNILYGKIKEYALSNDKDNWDKYGMILQGHPVNHDNHLHILIKCPLGDNKCTGTDGSATRIIQCQTSGLSSSINAFYKKPVIPYGAGEIRQMSNAWIISDSSSERERILYKIWEGIMQKNGITGYTFIGKLNSNAPDWKPQENGKSYYEPDNYKSKDLGISEKGAKVTLKSGKLTGATLIDEKGRLTFIFVPSSTDLSKPIELMYYFHGIRGFSRWDFRDRLAPQIKIMMQQHRNFVLVAPQLPWSGHSFYDDGNSRPLYDKIIGDSPLWDGSDSNLVLLQQDALDAVYEITKINPTIGYISMLGHSAGGAAMEIAALEGNQLSYIAPQKIVFSDADYGWRDKSAIQVVYDNYIKGSTNSDLYIFVRQPSSGGDLRPTGNGIRFMRNLNIDSTQAWDHNICAANDKKGCGTNYDLQQGAWKTPGASVGVLFTPPEISNIHFRFFKEDHHVMGSITLSWLPDNPTTVSEVAIPGYTDIASAHEDIDNIDEGIPVEETAIT